MLISPGGCAFICVAISTMLLVMRVIACRWRGKKKFEYGLQVVMILRQGDVDQAQLRILCLSTSNQPSVELHPHLQSRLPKPHRRLWPPRLPMPTEPVSEHNTYNEVDLGRHKCLGLLHGEVNQPIVKQETCWFEIGVRLDNF